MRRPNLRRDLTLHLAIGIAITLTLGFLDHEVHSAQDLMRLENVPALVIYLCLSTLLTIILRALVDWSFTRRIIGFVRTEPKGR